MIVENGTDVDAAGNSVATESSPASDSSTEALTTADEATGMAAAVETEKTNGLQQLMDRQSNLAFKALEKEPKVLGF